MSSNPMRDLLLAMEDYARRDPQLNEKPVIAMRLRDMNVQSLEAVWGPNWREGGVERGCDMCAATLFIRRIFADCKTVVCQRCAPEFVKSLEGGPQA